MFRDFDDDKFDNLYYNKVRSKLFKNGNVAVPLHRDWSPPKREGS